LPGLFISAAETNGKVMRPFVTPGFTATDLTGNEAGQSPQQAAAVIVRYATLDEHAPSGKFFRYDTEMPW
jgi:hypothetical protein